MNVCHAFEGMIIAVEALPPEYLINGVLTDEAAALDALERCELTDSDMVREGVCYEACIAGPWA